jgi:DNA (cytosine-5)-methyltransferase 1
MAAPILPDGQALDVNLYNENNPEACSWLNVLIEADCIAKGTVDQRNILEINPREFKKYQQCHFFAGIGGWSYALRLADWPDDAPVWTGSCPCQPFSQAGQRKVDEDERHLWPTFRASIAKCRPAIVFGEQVASKDGRIWITGVRADMEALGYAFGASDLCSAGISAPHIRQRLFWVAVTKSKQMGNIRLPWIQSHYCDSGGVGISNHEGWKQGRQGTETARHGNSIVTTSRNDIGMADTDRYHSNWWSGPLQVGRNCIAGEVERSGRKYHAQWRLKPGLSILADGVPGRVAQLCGFGNAIVPQLAAEFIKASQEAIMELWK